MDEVAAILHRLDPFVVGFVRWYGLAYVAGFALAYVWLHSLASRGLTPLKPERVGDFVCALAVGTIVGGRLGYCAFYLPELLFDFSSDFPFWGALAINKGGMASHGGIIGLALAILWFARGTAIPTLHLLDLMALVAPVGIFFGRVANFINGELYGRICSPGLPWGVKFPQEIADWADPANPQHDILQSPAFDKVVDLARSTGEGTTGTSPTLYEIAEAVQTNDAVAYALAELLPSRHPSQLYAALLEGALVLLVLMWFWRVPRKPGLVSAVAGITYACVRVVGEQFRTPDSHIGFEWLGLTRGQWLSFGLLATSVAAWWLWNRRPTAPMGGWKRQPKRQATTPTL